LVDGAERVLTHGTEPLDEAGSVDASKLPKKNQGIDATSAVASGYQHLGGVGARSDARSKRRDDRCLRCTIRVVVLNNDRRTGLLNLVPDRRIERDKPDFTASGYS
jgi:hypothetical protein